MKLSKFKYKLPEELIALHPEANRDESRLMVVHRDTKKIEDRVFKDIIDYFDDQDVMVFNNTKVFPARFMAIKKKPVPRLKCFCCAS
jgi:S-adenosylmethionine:tRNA ribosyltransferase-isomerase